MQDAFLGEGIDTDYMVSSLFADDFKFNRFNQSNPVLRSGTVTARLPAPKIAASRRLQQNRADPQQTWISLQGGFASQQPTWISIIPIGGQTL